MNNNNLLAMKKIKIFNLVNIILFVLILMKFVKICTNNVLMIVMLMVSVCKIMNVNVHIFGKVKIVKLVKIVKKM